jgi:redox-sensing transcriptional repressor
MQTGVSMVSNRSCIIRLSKYKNALNRLRALGFVKVFSDNLADGAGVTSSQVRKDFSLFGITGNKRGGYKVDELIEQLREILGKNETKEVIIVGMGRIGRALLNYNAFQGSGIRIVAGFDIDPEKFREDDEIPVLPLDGFTDYVRSRKIQVAVLAVPDVAAQRVSEIMVAAGVKGILNFAPIHLRPAKDAVINNINLEVELENLIYFVNESGKSGD